MKPLYLFDMGQVVATNVLVLPEIAARLGLSQEGFLNFCGSPLAWGTHGGLLDDLQTGRLGSLAFWDKFEPLSGRPRPTEDLWETCFRPRPIVGTVELIGRLRDRGHRVVCATNTLDAHYEIHLARGDYDIFDAVYASHLMGVAKPRPEFWTRILEAEGVAAREAVFIDDATANVEAARTLGIESHLFTTSGALSQALGLVESFVPKKKRLTAEVAEDRRRK